MRTITELKQNYPGKIIQTVSFASHAPGHPMTDAIHNRTYEHCVKAINEGKKNLYW